MNSKEIVYALEEKIAIPCKPEISNLQDAIISIGGKE